MMKFNLQNFHGKLIKTINRQTGHGGKDPGRPTNFGYKEKDIALKIVLKIGENLEKHQNIKVIYTRNTECQTSHPYRGSTATYKG